jgi:predicted alternative tryptophan synthase beta-subunit
LQWNNCSVSYIGVYTFDGDGADGARRQDAHPGHTFVPPSIHAGVRYHGMAPSLCALYDAGKIEAVAVRQKATFEAALQFARAEGIIPAPESAHAIRAAIDEALDAKEKGENRVILFNLSGHGNFDMGAYEAYLAASWRTRLSCRIGEGRDEGPTEGQSASIAPPVKTPPAAPERGRGWS